MENHGEMEKQRSRETEKPGIISEIGFIIDFDTDAGNLPGNNGNCACYGIQLVATEECMGRTLIAWMQVNRMVSNDRYLWRYSIGI